MAGNEKYKPNSQNNGKYVLTKHYEKNQKLPKKQTQFTESPDQRKSMSNKLLQ